MPGRLAIDFGTSNTVVAVWDEARQEGVPLHVPAYEGVSINANWASISETLRKSKNMPETEFVLGYHKEGKLRFPEEEVRDLREKLAQIQVFSLDAGLIASPVQLQPDMALNQQGGSLAGVLDRLRDQAPERFEALNNELKQWFPEFDKILFDTPDAGQRSFLLRTRGGHYGIPASDLSQGTLLALAILTLAYLPNPPSLVGLEEPDRGIHPRLLRQIQDALYRLCYPEDYGEKRAPVQVIATTHSPYLLDLYRDYLEETVIAQKIEDGARFERLSEQPQVLEILGDAPLGEVWFSGVLGGVPAEQ
jgi:predicted ATPase